MRIIFAADIHASPNHLANLIETALSVRAEGIIVGGDIVPHDLPQFKGLSLVMAQATYLRKTFIPAFKELKRQRPVPVYLDMGNDDLAANRSILEAYDGILFQLLHHRRRPLAEGIDLLGYMMVPPTPFNRKDWEKPDTAAVPCRPGNQTRVNGFITRMGREEKYVLDLKSPETIEADLARLASKIRGPFVFVSHSPPADTPLDITEFGKHVGSVAIYNFIAEWAQKGLLVASLHGHIHESPAISGTNQTHINGALCINPGQNNGFQAPLKYILLNLDLAPTPPAIEVIAESDLDKNFQTGKMPHLYYPLIH